MVVRVKWGLQSIAHRRTAAVDESGAWRDTPNGQILQTQLNSGIAMVTPADAVKQLLMGEDVVKHRGNKLRSSFGNAEAFDHSRCLIRLSLQAQVLYSCLKSVEEEE